MRQKIITVEDTFLIQGRGLVVTGWKEDNSAEIGIGDSVEILRPNNIIIESQIECVEIFINRKDTSEFPEPKNVAFSLKNLSKEDVPIGSIINLTT